MKLNCVLFFTSAILALEPGATGFSIVDTVKNVVRDEVEEALRENTLQIYDGVALPSDMKPIDKLRNFLQLSKKTNIDVGLYLFDTGVTDGKLERSLATELDELVGTQKNPIDGTTEKRSELWRRMYAKTINKIIKEDADDPDPTEGYMYFGNQNYEKILPLITKTNPFFASALSLSDDKDYFELNAFSPESTKVKKTKFLTMMNDGFGDDPSHHINVRFTKDFEIDSITLNKDGKDEVVDKSKWNHYASGALYNLFYYASCVHANIHVLHYLMCGAINECTDHDDSLKAWASPYDDNIGIKYAEVCAILFPSKILGKPFPPSDPEGKDKVLTSTETGFGGTDKVMGSLKDMLDLWGSFKTSEDYMTKFLLSDLFEASNKDVEEFTTLLDSSGILTEYRKHQDNVNPFAEKLSDAMKDANKGAFRTAEDRLKKFMKGCGDNVSSIDTISSWVQLMSSTGLTHGTTLSYSRMILMPEVMAWRDISNTHWIDEDARLIGRITGTVQGMTPDRHVFTSSIDHVSCDTWDTDPINHSIMEVLKEYDGIAKDLQEKHKAALEENEDLREYGWILTDFGPDNYDGKQATITTYI